MNNEENKKKSSVKKMNVPPSTGPIIEWTKEELEELEIFRQVRNVAARKAKELRKLRNKKEI